MEPQFYEKDDKQTRSVFVGNIPYDATEDDLKTLFSKIGRVLSFRMVFDRETGKAKGYGFCEFPDLETANSAIRNLNGIEFKNRHLRVDCASIEKAREEPKLEEQVAPKVPIAHDISSMEAPEVIRNIMSTLPSEKIVELLKQIKFCLQDSPDETREMLIQNPQLSYAILQALLIMNLVDPQSAKAAVLNSRPIYSNRIKTFFPSDGDIDMDASEDQVNAGHFAPFCAPEIPPPPMHIHPMQQFSQEIQKFDLPMRIPMDGHPFQMVNQLMHPPGTFNAEHDSAAAFNWINRPPQPIQYMHDYRFSQDFDPRPLKRPGSRFEPADMDSNMQAYQNKLQRPTRPEENLNFEIHPVREEYKGGNNYRYRGDQISGVRGRAGFRYDNRRARY